MLAVGATSGLQLSQRCASTAASRAVAVTMMAGERYIDSSGQEIKPALSAYMHFCQERRSSLTAELKQSQGASFANTMVMKQLGAEWKVLDASSKDKFAQTAASDKVSHAARRADQQMPAGSPTPRGHPLSSTRPRPLSSCTQQTPAPPARRRRDSTRRSRPTRRTPT